LSVARAVAVRTWRRLAARSRDGTKYLYDGLKVNSATFSCAEGQPLALQIEVMGVDEAPDGDATETADFQDGSGPYVMSDCVLTVGGTEYQFRQMSINVMAGGDFRATDMARMWNGDYSDVLQDLIAAGEMPVTLDLDDMAVLNGLSSPDVEFKEYDESVENDVKYCTCPSCGHKFPQ
jgi:hypothetical protein